jgi:hypothetical protein
MAALLVVLAAAYSAPEALARNYTVKWTYELVPPETGPPEPGAYGQYTVTFDSRAQMAMAAKEVAVNCRRLTSGRPYDVVVLVAWNDQWDGYGWYLKRLTFTADAKGRLNGQFTVGGGESYVYV